jgi:hypothetical protein
MKIFFLSFEVIPTKNNEKFDLVQEAIAECWIKSSNAKSAYAKAAFFIQKENWEILKIENYPIEVIEKHFLNRGIGEKQFLKAKEDGIAIMYLAWSRDGKTAAGPIPIKESFKFPLFDFIYNQKKLTKKGRCLHYDNGTRCNEFIKAHSIQKNKSLTSIADNGHVYIISDAISSLKKNNGMLTFEERGINQVSTFLGFCKRHDNELFEPIDNYYLIPADQQVLLYAYRSLCREYFVKENSFVLIKKQLENIPEQKFVNNVLSAYVEGTSFGFENLKRHKANYDKTLIRNSYSDVRYVIFISKQKPTIVFSGLFYPEFDFCGRMLQNLRDHTKELQLITFCSGAMDNGWAYLFAWHNTSSNICVEFMRSLATMIYDNPELLCDYLFRLVISNCENLAISPTWWINLEKEKKNKILERVNLTADNFEITERSYLMKGLEGMSDWKFESVLSKMN